MTIFAEMLTKNFLLTKPFNYLCIYCYYHPKEIVPFHEQASPESLVESLEYTSYFLPILFRLEPLAERVFILNLEQELQFIKNFARLKNYLQIFPLSAVNTSF